MQLRFQDKEHFFHDTAQMLQSGIPLQRAMEHLASGRDRAAAAARIAAPIINNGLDEALRKSGFSTVDSEILSAGEQSGRMEEACRQLAEYYSHLAAGRRRAISASLYPLFILHLGAILLSIPPAIISGGFPEFLKQVILFLGAAYLIGGLLAFLAWRVAVAFRKSPRADVLLRRLPVAGGFLWEAALARFCLVLSLGIRSAGGVLSSLQRAGRASKCALIEEGSDQAVTAIRSGSGFAEALRTSTAFPADLERTFHVAEASGRLEEEITRWAGIYRERFFQRIESLTTWLPRILYLIVVGLVVVRMFSLISQVTGAFSAVLDI